MPRPDPKHWAPPLALRPEQGEVVREPPGRGPGHWAGAPGAAFDAADQTYYLVYRLRRPRGEGADRGYEIQLARSRDGLQFDTIWTAGKDELGSPSIERCAVRRLADGRWGLYVSYVDPADGRWRIDLVEAERPDQFRLSEARPVLTAAEAKVDGVKDPFVFQVAGQYHMLVSFAAAAEGASPDQLHGQADAYNTGLIRSATGLAVSQDGRRWRWVGEVFGPSGSGWDGYCSRIGCVWREAGLWLAVYDGSAEVGENYEERAGLAYSFDLRRFFRATPDGPWAVSPHGRGSLRYVDVLAFPDALLVYYEMARRDGGHDLRAVKIER